MGFPKNLSSFVSDEDVKNGNSALFYREVPGTPCNLTPRWASIRGERGTKTVMVTFYEYDEQKVHFPVKGVKKARGLAKAFVGVTGDGVRYCFGVDDEGCENRPSELATEEEIERGFCNACLADLMAEDDSE